MYKLSSANGLELIMLLKLWRRDKNGVNVQSFLPVKHKEM